MSHESTSPEVTAAVQAAAWQNPQRRGGLVGSATSPSAPSQFAYGQLEVGIGDSILAGYGSTNIGRTDWFSILGINESRTLGFPDSGIGFVDAAGGGGTYNLPQFNAVGASLTAVAGLGPANAGATNTAVQLTGTAGSQLATNSLTDNRIFSRALIFYAPTASSDNIGVSITGQGGANVHTITGSATSSPGNSTVSFYDTGVVSGGSTLSLWRITAGGVAPTVFGALYYAPGVTGTQGLNMINLGAGGSATTDWISNRNWESLLGCLGSSVRRVHIRLGVNDYNSGTALATISANLTTIISRIRAQLPNTEIAMFSEYQPSHAISTTGGSYISAGDFAANYVPMVQQVAYANNCSYVDMFGRFGSVASFTFTDQTGTGATTNLSSASAKFSQYNVGALISNTGGQIPANAYIKSVNSPTNITMSAAASGTITGTVTVNNDAYGLTIDNAHFGGTANSASGVDGQRAHAEAVMERLSYSRSLSGSLVNVVGNQIGYVVSGCTWTPDSAGSTLNASMAWGQIVINGQLLNVSPVAGHAFAANSDTYVDLTNNGIGGATVTYTAVANNSTSPKLINSTLGNMGNTVRVAVITTGATSIAATGNIGQGSTVGVSPGASAPSTTVAAGSNGNALSTSTLTLASGTGFSATGGWAQVSRTSAPVEKATIQYTGISGAVLQGVTVLQGTASGTVTTGDAVAAMFQTNVGIPSGPMGVTDFLGNLIYPTRPTPTIIGWASYSSAQTFTQTVNTPLPGLIAPFIIPTGPARSIRLMFSCVTLNSSATAGSTVDVNFYIGNKTTTVSPSARYTVAVSSDGIPISMAATAASPLAAGSYVAQVWVSPSAAGTTTVGQTFLPTVLSVELM